jgi:pimeloyl-ACP methyl ester carboxylesterase
VIGTPTLSASCGELFLRDGSVLRGTLETPATLRGDNQATPGFIRVDDGLRRFLIHDKLRERWEDTTPITSLKAFRIAQPLSKRNPNLVIGHIVSIVSISQFDEFGRRTFTVRDARGETAIPQGITEINAEYIKLTSLSHMWESSISTQSVPPSVVEAILRKSIDNGRVDDRLRLFRFFMAAEWYVQAENELKAIEQEFPKLDAEEIRHASALLEEAKARRRLREIKLRRTAGQHGLAFQLLRDFPLDGASGEVVVEVRDLTKQYESLVDRMQIARRQIDRLRSSIQDSELLTRLSPPLEEISQSLDHPGGIARLDSFLSVLENESISAEHKLGAAISGWVAGNAFAEPNLDRALLLWDGRGQIVEYLNEPHEGLRDRMLTQLKAKEVLPVELAGRVVENLLPQVPTLGLEREKPTKISLPTGGDRTVDYWVLLPPEYSPCQSYPLIITLHGRGVTPEVQLNWWSSPPGFQASRHGYIVLSPEYLPDPKSEYAYTATSHDIVLHSLIDARRRFMVDSDRVFITGHSMGGDAAWDIGLAHPDLFAGVVPICGAPQKFSEFYWPNGQNTAFYIVDGEKDGTNPEQIIKTARRMMENGYDVTYAEFRGRGHENFSDETLRLFEWMSRKSRRKFPLKFSTRTARATDNEFYFVTLDDFAAPILMDPHNFDRRKMKPGQIEGRINGIANSVTLTISGAKQADVWLSPGMVEFGRPITVHANRDEVSGRAIRPDLGVLLEDFRVRWDRQKLFYAKVSFPRL